MHALALAFIFSDNQLIPPLNLLLESAGMAEPSQDIIPDKPVLPQVECRNEWHHQVHKDKPAPLAVGVMLGAFDCEGF